MKLVIHKSQLQRGLSRLQAIVEKRNSMPILANALLSVSQSDDDARLALVATDLEVGVRSLHDAQVETPGAISIGARKLYDIVRELPDEDVTLDAAADSYLKVTCGRAQFSLAGAAAEEYPELPDFSPSSLAQLPAAVLSVMIDRTMYAASLDETRYNLNGVYFEASKQPASIRMVATDGHRLALADHALGFDVEGLASGVIIPRKGLAELKRLVDEDDADEVSLGFEGNNGLARKGDVTLVMRLIEGEFPNYNQVIPTASEHKLCVPTEALTRALRRVALLSAERSRAVKLVMEAGSLQISSSNPDLGEAQEEVDVDYEGSGLSIGFNARYLLDSLAAVGSKEVEISLLDANSPAQVRATDGEPGLAVVMPMRL